MAAPDGKQYEWKSHFGGSFTVRTEPCTLFLGRILNNVCLQLFDLQLGHEVAKSQTGSALHRRPLTLDVHPDVLPILDAVVLSFIYLEALARAARTSAATG